MSKAQTRKMGCPVPIHEMELPIPRLQQLLREKRIALKDIRLQYIEMAQENFRRLAKEIGPVLDYEAYPIAEDMGIEGNSVYIPVLIHVPGSDHTQSVLIRCYPGQYQISTVKIGKPDEKAFWHTHVLLETALRVIARLLVELEWNWSHEIGPIDA